ncbi:MAG: PQQ-binding-like beta-propeller repeat protein [Verrucomicrobiota bacterium]
MKTTASFLTLAVFSLTPLLADDWPTWGGAEGRNMVSPDVGIPSDFNPGDFLGMTEDIDMATTEGVKWVAKLGSQSYGTPVVGEGKILVGTNNEIPRSQKHLGDRGIIYCLDEETGEFEWQFVALKLGAGKVSDWEYLGICSSPHIEGDRAWFVSNRCEIVCVDLNGLSDGNQGFQEEVKYVSAGEPVELDESDADILWIYDMRAELGVFPHNIASNAPIIHGDLLYVSTSNGVDWSHINIPSPQAPSLIALDKNTGELKGEEASGISKRILHCNWSSPAITKGLEEDLLVFGAGDGFLYGFDLEPVLDEDGFGILEERFRYDCNPASYRRDENGKPIKYATFEGPSELIATPVIVDDMIYVGIGQDPEHGEGLGNFVAVPAGSQGSGELAAWSFDGIERTISTAAVADGLVYVSDYTGRLFCLDAKTGEMKWEHDTRSHIWGSPLVADGKVYLGNEDGIITIYKAGPELEVLNEIEFSSPIYSSPVVANGVLYVTSQTHLYAFGE